MNSPRGVGGVGGAPGGTIGGATGGGGGGVGATGGGGVGVAAAGITIAGAIIVGFDVAGFSDFGGVVGIGIATTLGGAGTVGIVEGGGVAPACSRVSSYTTGR